ncbi:MAG: AAA family ATPase [Candidatus Aenigmarchaeota archaeon]|nr:AAA family ATPase [Candidatus Aenigmarchaeota archaeon]
MIERVTSGIPGLDKLISGGFVKGSTTLITGGTGTGKTTFCCQFLLDGLQKGEPGVYLSMEEDPEDIKDDMKVYGWDLEKYEKSKKLKIVYQNPFEVADVSAKLMETVSAIKAKRVVIDPISLMGLYIKDEAAVRKKFYQLTRILKEAGVTSIITSEILEDSKALSRDGVIEFVVDGVVILTFLGLGEASDRSVMVRKMRRTKHGTEAYKLEIGNKGLAIKKVSL